MDLKALNKWNSLTIKLPCQKKNLASMKNAVWVKAMCVVLKPRAAGESRLPWTPPRLALHWLHPGIDSFPVFIVAAFPLLSRSCFPPCLVLPAVLTWFALFLVGGRALNLRPRPSLIDRIKQSARPLMIALTAVSAHRYLINARLYNTHFKNRVWLSIAMRDNVSICRTCKK